MTSSHSERSFGILTLATPNDYLKAIGLALSLKVSNPGIPVAVACSPKVRPLVEPYFSTVVDEQAGLKGFVHKVYLDRYSPFDDTLFLDSDVLVFKPVRPHMDAWGDLAYTACGTYQTDGKSSFGMDRAEVLKKIGKSAMTVIDGAGHAWFRKPACFPVFDFARHVTEHHAEYVGNIPYADEDVMDVAMTHHGLPPQPYADFFSRYISAVRGSVKMDASIGFCKLVLLEKNRAIEPCMMHFAANEAALLYHWQLHKLFKKFGVDTTGLWSQAISDFHQREIRLPVHLAKKRILQLFA